MTNKSYEGVIIKMVLSYPLAVLMLVVAMLCLGSWPNLQISSRTKFGVFYNNYALGILGVSFFVFLLGLYGLYRNPVHINEPNLVLYSVFSGVVWNIGNIMLAASIKKVGVSVAFPIGVGIALVEGVLTNYIKQPFGNPYLLFSGVFVLTVAIFANGVSCYFRDRSEEKGCLGFGGIFLAAFSGFLLGWTYRILMNGVLNNHPMMTIHLAFSLFCLGVFASTLVLFSVRSVFFKDQEGLPRISICKKSIAAGLVWGVGFYLVLIASNSAGFAISDALSQGATMVAALWGVFLWKEFDKYKKIKRAVLWSFLLYIAALTLIILAHYF